MEKPNTRYVLPQVNCKSYLVQDGLLPSKTSLSYDTGKKNNMQKATLPLIEQGNVLSIKLIYSLA